MKPVAKALPEAETIDGSGEVIRINYDLSVLRVTLVFENLPNSVEVLFSMPTGFRVLDEGDLVEFWRDYHTGNGWLYEVSSGGWHELESRRDGFITQHTDGVKEYLVVGTNDCVSVLAHERPKVKGGNAT